MTALVLALVFAASAGGVQAQSPLQLTGEPAAMPPPRAASMKPVDGLEINYDLLDDPGIGTPGRLQGVVSVPNGSVATSVLVRPGAAPGERVARLDTSWKTRWPGAQQPLVFGDTVGSGGGWSRPVRFGGIRLGRPLVLRPGFDAAPEAATGATAALPASGLALAEGAAQARIAAREMLATSHGEGHPVTGAPAPLTEGAFDYELEAGRLRTGRGTAQDRYGDAYLAAAWRQGLWSALTAEGRAEWTPDRSAGGLELSRAFLDGSTVARVVLAHSSSVLVQSGGELVHSGTGLPIGTAAGAPRTPLSGLRRGMALEGQAGGNAWTLSWDGFDREFTPLAATPGEPDVRARVRAGTSLPLWGRASATVSYAHQTRWVGTSEGVLGLVAQVPLAERTQLLMKYSLRNGAEPGWKAGLTLSVPLERGPGH